MPSLPADEPTRATDDPAGRSGDPRPGLDATEGTEVGRYVLLGRLGAGGMGDVFAAFDPELDRKVAIKLVRIDVVAQVEEAQARLLREAKALAKLSHPNVVAVFDAGTHDDRVFVAMEFVDGRTLTAWKDERSRPWRDVVAMMLQAGRGLEAAHAAGIVHRDFKPSNVMVTGGQQGSATMPRARVLDFGLARGLELETDAALSGSRDRDPSISQEISGGSRPVAISLTRTGMVMGTPAYMAPEQFAGRSIDARTDQFSFCVVLYRLLYGKRPFSGHKFDELQDEVLRGALRDPGRHAAIPGRLRTILERGLAGVPDERYPSMSGLLSDLERVLSARRRRLVVASIAMSAGMIGGATWLMVRGPAPCAGTEERLVGVWDQQRRSRVATAFAATEKAYAIDAWAVVEPRLDDFASAWNSERKEACEATRVRAEQSEALMDLRMACLDRQLVEASALVELFANADAKIAENASSAVQRLPSPTECANTEALTSAVAPPSAEIEAEVEDIYAGLARVHALFLSGKYAESRVLATELLTRARDSGYRPAIARSALIVGQAQERLSDVDDARASYQVAMLEGAASGDANSEAQGMTGLCSLLGIHFQELDDALLQCSHAEATLERIGSPTREIANVELYRANARFRARELAEAQEAFERVLELTEDVPSAQTAHLAALSNLSGVLAMRGKFRESLELQERGANWVRTHHGEHHPTYAFFLNNMGASYINLERYEEANAKLEEAIAVYEGAFGRDHFENGRVYHNLAIAKNHLGDLEGSLQMYRQALEIKRAVYGDGHPSVARSANSIAETLVALGQLEEALAQADEAIRIWDATQGTNAPDVLLGLTSKIEVLRAMGRIPDDALIDRGLRLANDDNTEPGPRAKFRFLAAEVLARSPSERPRARKLAELAREHYVDSETPSLEEIAEIDAWLATHGT